MVTKNPSEKGFNAYEKQSLKTLQIQYNNLKNNNKKLRLFYVVDGIANNRINA